MGINIYERPREKMQQKGVSALTNTELLQVVIGSGSAGMPVTKIARKVGKVLKAKGLSVAAADLTTIQGLGVVKAGQLLAAFELAFRVSAQSEVRVGEESILADIYSDIRSSKTQILFYAFFDGNNQLIDDHSQAVQQTDDTNTIVRKLFAEALSQSTASILIAIGFQHQPLEPTMFELGLARDAYKTAALLSLQLTSFVLVGPSGEYVVKDAKHG